MKKLIIGGVLGTIVGAGGIFGAIQIPKINEALVLKEEKQELPELDFESQNKIDNLENSNSALQEEIINLSNKLTEAEKQIKIKDDNIATKVEEINQLMLVRDQLLEINDELENKDIPALNDTIIELSSENATLKQELDTYKELVGTDITYVEIINNLTSQLELAETNLTIANAELEQLRLDKETLTTRVSELESTLAEVQDKLSKYEDLEHIDKFAVSSFDGTWYKNNSFEDYFIIKDGVVVHNANEDTGIVQNLYNQMYLFMNQSESIPVDLSDDGTQFVTSDGNIYSLFYTNTKETILPDLITLSGQYSYLDNLIDIRSDNVISLDNGVKKLIGTYTATGSRQNVGGNIFEKYFITASFNDDDDEVIIKSFEFILSTKTLIDTELNVNYSLVSSSPSLLTYSSTWTPSSISSSQKYLKFTIKTEKSLTIPVGSSLTLTFHGFKMANTQWYINGQQFSATTSSHGFAELTTTLKNNTDEVIINNLFDFYAYGPATYVSYPKSITYNGEKINIEIVSAEDHGSQFHSNEYLNNKFFNSSDDFYKKLHTPVFDYIDGSYTSDNIQLDITSDTAIVTLLNLDSITASTYEILSQTDGYDIYQTITIKYITTELVEEVETEITHTIKIDLKNNNVVSSTLDNENIVFSKN